MNRKNRWIVVLVLVVLLAGVLLIEVASGRRGHITISKETTYLTEPVRPDGYVDYVAGLNQRCSEGVTPENNASVLFWRAMGPNRIREPSRQKFFESLGIAPLPETGDYFIDSAHVIARLQAEAKPKAEETPSTEFMPPLGAAGMDENDPAQAMFDMAMERPWSRQEFPALADWLDSNEKPLALVLEGTQRPRRYEPLFCVNEEDGLLICAQLPGSQRSRDFARALRMRAMLRLQENRIDDAWGDLLSCHRLARLVGQGPTMVDLLVGYTIDGIGCIGDQSMLQCGHSSAEQLARMRTDLDQLPPMPKMVDKVDLAERLTYLDAMSHVARQGLAAIGEISGGGLSGGPPSNSTGPGIGSTIGLAMIDWDSILRAGNRWYDRYTDALHQPTRTAQKEALKNMEEDLDAIGAAARDWPHILGSAILSPRRTVSNELSQVAMSLLMPAVSAALSAEDRSLMASDLNRLAFALAAYRVDQGAYPAKLADLVPKYVAELPKDIFSDADPHYQQEGNGYLLYSVGRNGKDDGGSTMDDREKSGHPADGDDITVRMSK